MSGLEWGVKLPEGRVALTSWKCRFNFWIPRNETLRGRTVSVSREENICSSRSRLHLVCCSDMQRVVIIRWDAFLILSDSLALVLALRKGRSNKIFYIAKKSCVGSLRLASGQVLSYRCRWIPSELKSFFFDCDYGPSKSFLCTVLAQHLRKSLHFHDLATKTVFQHVSSCTRMLVKLAVFHLIPVLPAVSIQLFL